MLYEECLDGNVAEGGVDKVKHYLDQLASGFSWKMVLSLLGTLVCSLENFYSSLLWWFLSLFILDLLTGILKSKKAGKTVSSKRLRDSVYKLAAYMVLLTSVIVASKVENAFASIIPITYYYYMFTELKSIVENVELMGVPVPGCISMKVKHLVDESSGRVDKDPVTASKEEPGKKTP